MLLFTVMEAENSIGNKQPTFEEIVNGLRDLSPITAQAWQRERASYISKNPGSIFALTPEFGKIGLTSAVNRLVRKGLGTQHAIAMSTDEELIDTVGRASTPLTKQLAMALRAEAIIRITQG